MAETSALTYPPIAQVAHMEGTVVLVVRFDPSGVVTHVEPAYGPLQFKGVFEIFKNVTVAYAQGLKANTYSGPRECPIAITFRLTGPSDRECGADEAPTPPTIKRVDLQHVIVVHTNGCVTVTRDPIGKRVHRFHF